MAGGQIQPCLIFAASACGIANRVNDADERLDLPEGGSENGAVVAAVLVARKVHGPLGPDAARSSRDFFQPARFSFA